MFVTRLIQIAAAAAAAAATEGIPARYCNEAGRGLSPVTCLLTYLDNALHVDRPVYCLSTAVPCGIASRVSELQRVE